MVRSTLEKALRDAVRAGLRQIGYADDLVGYIPDPKAFENKEYAALVVPKITGLPPFAPTAGRELTEAALKLLRKLK